MKRLWRWLAGICAGLALLSFFGGYGHTRRNAADIRAYRDPLTEIRFFERTPDGRVRPRRLEGSIARTASGYELRIVDLMAGGGDLVLRLPAAPARNSGTLKVAYEPTRRAGRTIPVQLFRGAFDDNLSFDTSGFFSGMPDRAIVGAVWDAERAGDERIAWYVGYQPAQDQRFTTVWTEAGLPWMRRTAAELWAMRARYAWTVPLDIVTAPYQLYERAARAR